jgi:hypothetical protein
MELGFRDDYFARALWRTGWFGRKIALPGLDRLRVWEARHRAAAAFRFTATDGNLHTQVGIFRDGAIVLDRAAKGSGLFGPYIDLPAGRYVARLNFRPEATLHGRAVADVVCDVGRTRLAQARIDARAGAQPLESIEMAFASDADMIGVEVRLLCAAGFSATLDSVEITPLAANAGESS